MRRFLVLAVVLLLVAGGVVSAAGKQSRIDRQTPRHDAGPAGSATIQIEASIEGQLWLFLGHRGGDAFWLQAVPLLSADITNQLRSIYDGPDPTTSYSDRVEADEDEGYDTLGGVQANNGGVAIRPTGGGSSEDD